MDIRYFIGIDIAKATLDWAVCDGKKMVLQTNTPKYGGWHQDHFTALEKAA